MTDLSNDWPRPIADDWRSLAACRGMDVNDFHPDKGHSVTATRAKAVCAACPVREDCLRFAMGNDICVGIYGGLSPRERGTRRPLRNQPQPINHGTEGGYGTHRRRGEEPCWACSEAARIARQRRSAS